MRTIELNEEQTELWEQDSPEGERYRANMREVFRNEACEVYAHDGITLDAWEPA